MLNSYSNAGQPKSNFLINMFLQLTGIAFYSDYTFFYKTLIAACPETFNEGLI